MSDTLYPVLIATSDHELRTVEFTRVTELLENPWDFENVGRQLIEEIKELNRLLTMKREMTPEEQGAAEEMQMMIDRLDYGLSGYNRTQQARFVRLWNKSRKQRYKL